MVKNIKEEAYSSEEFDKMMQNIMPGKRWAFGVCENIIGKEKCGFTTVNKHIDNCPKCRHAIFWRSGTKKTASNF